jgi:uncharacterized membrane protein YfcA
MTPLLLLFFDIKTVVVVTAILEIAAGVTVTIQARNYVDKKSLFIVLPVSVLGIVFGAYILVSFDSGILKKIFGGFTMLFAQRILIILWRGQTGRKVWPSVYGYVSGVLGGVLGGLFGTAGPPIAIYLENQLRSKDTLRATMLMYFLVIDMIRLIPYTYSSLMTFSVLKICLVALPASVAGAFRGKKVHLSIHEVGFRIAVSVVLIGTGFVLMVGI